MLKANKGITLVALIITIIVLLILAGVSISMVLGNNGLLNNSKNAVNKYKAAEKNETNMLNEAEGIMQNYMNIYGV